MNVLFCSRAVKQNISRKSADEKFRSSTDRHRGLAFFVGTLIFGLIGLIGNLVCFVVVNRFSFSSHSFVEYLRVLSLFDFLNLLYELLQSLNDLSVYLFAVNLLNFRSSVLCKFYDYSKYSIILLSCWTIVALTIDRFLLVCHPYAKRWPNLSRRVCNSECARRIILLLILLTLLINIPHLVYKEWVCRSAGFQHSAASHHHRLHFNQTKPLKLVQICACRVSPSMKPIYLNLFLIWNDYVFHLFSYTLLPAIILIASNAGLSTRCIDQPMK